MRRPFPGRAHTSSASLPLPPPMPPSRAGTALSAMSNYTSSSSTSSSSCKSHCYDPFLMPDTFAVPAAQPHEPAKSTPALLDPSRKTSSWETYLLETSQHYSDLDGDRRRMRRELLASMKTYYGNSRWDRVPAIGDDGVAYVADQPKYQPYTDQIVLFGEDRNLLRRRYYDRRGHVVPAKEFDIVKLDPDGNPRPGLLRRVTSRMLR